MNTPEEQAWHRKLQDAEVNIAHKIVTPEDLDRLDATKMDALDEAMGKQHAPGS